MRSTFNRPLVLPFVAILGLFIFPASEGSGGPQAQSKGHATATYFVAWYDVGRAALEGLHGVKKVESGFRGQREINTVIFDPAEITVETMVEALKRAGTYRGTEMTGKLGNGTWQRSGALPPIDASRPGGTATATFALGWFWGPDSRFGSLPGVLRTRVGYAGGSTENPTYHNIGDHIESVEVDFDPSVISYGELLDLFWSSHDPRAQPVRRQYMSAIFPHGDDQKNLAIKTRDREAARKGGKVHTVILPGSRFYLAEAYHQKFALRGRSELMKEYEAIYPSFGDFLASTAVARVNGYVAGYGTCGTLLEELDGLGLSPAGRKRLEDLVCPPGARRERSMGAACPAA